MALFELDKIYEQKNNFMEIPHKITLYLENNKSKSWKKNTFKPTDFLNKDNQSEYDKFCSYIREQLNKINADNYTIIIKNLNTIKILTLNELETYIKLIIEKAVREDKYANIYAKLCNHLCNITIISEEKEYVFRKILLSECQKFFNKITTQQNIRKLDSIGFISFLSELYNNNILAINNLSSCFDIMSNNADKNNLMVDIIITMLNLVAVNYKKKDITKYNNTISKLRKLSDDPKLSKRENIILDEALDNLSK